MKNTYFEKLKEAMEEQQEDYDIEPAYPIVEGVIWPPRNLADVKNNCEIWKSFGFYDPDDMPTEETISQKPTVSIKDIKRFI
ncbi:hypothetical protein FMJ45_25590 [Klebsiella michiganensis]|uniref:hypothetical protein n=1 Tax=Klebsiella michiganensis TaxID=1134687 RepID=UPI0018AB8C50|nr:hypothetical protein [Klebsiella michiganensis]MBF8474306.1 hypothetical protein [Klebsiella michiganensis]MBZ6604502.1 hypothetical protein [Klebsiella michiganensis]